MPEVAQPEPPAPITRPVSGNAVAFGPGTALSLGLVTLAWKLVECTVSAYAAWTAHSPALLAFGSDSVVELISALVVLSQWRRGRQLTEQHAARLAALLLTILAFIVAAAATASLALHIHPDNSRSGIAITLASLLVMPLLAHRKRLEARRLGNAALAADAVQSATCAYLALLTLLGLVAHALLGVAWFDDLAAFLAIPVLLREARIAWRGHLCAVC